MKGRLVAVAVVVALLALAAWAECTLEVVPFKRRAVDMPTARASPQEVVAAYVEALDAHDCDTARRLWLGGGQGTAEMWCAQVRRAHIVGGMHAFHENRRWIDVSLTLDVRWRPFENDGSIEGNPFPWTYILARESRGAWRIGDNGQG
jgi:hypothetical protein